MDRRSQIVLAAADLFARRGYAATSVADISIAVGLSPSAGGLYRHFDSKDVLLEAVVDMALARVREADELRQYMSQQAVQLDALTEAQLGARHLLDKLRENRSVLQIMERDLTNHPRLLHRVHSELVTPVMSGLVAWINNLNVVNRRSDLDVEGLAEIMWGALRQRGLSDHHATTDEQATTAWAAALVGALTTPSNTEQHEATSHV